MRKILNINDNWMFHKGPMKNGKVPKKPKSDWQNVNLPHTWNNLDGQDGGSDFYRDTCWYCKEISLDLSPTDVAYIEFLGANSVCEIYANGDLIKRHEGGYSTFRANLTPYIKRKKIKLAVKVDNSDNKNIYPQTADFTFFGGIYRDVNIIVTSIRHFDLDYYGTTAITATPVVNNDGSADVELCAYTKNAGENDTVKFTVDSKSFETNIVGNKATAQIHFDTPHLWNGRKDPFLYEFSAKLIHDGDVCDMTVDHFGIRTFKIDSDKGFFLNGKSYPLHGVSRHQDREDMGWAITRKEHEEDMNLICEVGANTIRLAHYQHSPVFYDLCDEKGMVVWAEIPFISVFSKTSGAMKNTIHQMKELVLQNYNRPSIVCWGIANEITIGGECHELYDNLEKLNDLCHELDKTRLTTMANLSMVEPESEMNKITDIVSYNHYFGWYMGNVDDNGPWLDNFHKINPDVCLGVSEYGCEGILKYHNDEPKMQDYSEEYQAYYHEKMLETFSTRPYLWSTHVWNMFDFASDMRDEGGVKGRNNKGLVTYDRKTKKDSFYIYKAYWCDEPFVHICSKRYVDRTSENIDIKVYSNQNEVTLFVNGVETETIKADKIFVFKNIKLKKGENTVIVKTETEQDSARFNLTDIPNESYVLVKAKNEGKNWFDDLETDKKVEFKEGYFNLEDKIGDIMKNPEGEKFILEMVDKISSEMGMNISKGMMNMVKNFTASRVFDMAGDRVPQSAKVWVAQQLSKIKK